jgi:hypothetical protein
MDFLKLKENVYSPTADLGTPNSIIHEKLSAKNLATPKMGDPDAESTPQQNESSKVPQNCKKDMKVVIYN